LVCAPAGFGKTTLVCDWLQRSRLPAAWVSLDESDSDLATYCRYLVAAVQTVFPNACAETLALVSGPPLAPPSHIGTVLANEIAALPQDFILVLDDYHVIRSMSVHELLIALTRHQPECLHLVIISRTDPPLPVARLRVLGQAEEIRSGDLRFAREEMKMFIERAAGTTLNDDEMKVLEENTEGWIAGLRLVAIAMNQSHDHSSFVSILGNKGRQYMMDYLLDNVLLSQPQPVQDFLLRASILNSVCASLCDTLAPDEQPWHSYSILDDLERANLFLSGLVGESEWFRFHPLFRQLLYHKLQATSSVETIASLHRKASLWLEQNGYIEEALHQALATKDIELGAELVERHIQSALNQEQWHTLEKWLSVLPDDQVQRRPALLLAQAWIVHFQGKFSALAPLLQQVEELLSNPASTLGEQRARELRSEIDAFYAESWFWQNEGERSLECAERALEHLPREQLFVRGVAAIYFGGASQITGRKHAAVQLLRNELERTEGHINAYTLRLELALAEIYLLSGEYDHLGSAARQLHVHALEKESLLMAAWGEYLMGVVHYERNELDEAEEHWEHGVQLRYSSHLRVAHECMLGLALVHQARGSYREADQALAELLEFDETVHTASQLAEARSVQAHVALMRGDLQTARHWSETLNTGVGATFLHWLEFPPLTQVKVLLAQGMEGNPGEAQRHIVELVSSAETAHNTRYITQALCLQALALSARGLEDQALEVLDRAVLLARPAGFVRTFVDLGPGMESLLRALLMRDAAPEYLGRVLSAFSAARPADEVTMQRARPEAKGQVGSLTYRELDILRLLQERMSDKEIARRLSISSLTVRTHTNNIYQKLGVNGRREAVSKALELHIFN